MEQNDDLKGLWKKNSNQNTNTQTFNKENLEPIITSRIRLEKKKLAEYFWLSLSYQIIIYSFGCYLVIKFWGNTDIFPFAIAGILLYLPLTAILLTKFKSMYNAIEGPINSIQEGVRNQFQQLSSFFNFKKRFDFIAIPITCLIMLIVLFRIYVGKNLRDLIPVGIIVYLLALIIFAIAAWFENKKHFIRPLKRLELILKDMETVDSH